MNRAYNSFDEQVCEYTRKYSRESEAQYGSRSSFFASFIDSDGVIKKETRLSVEGQGDIKRYTLSIPKSLWTEWSTISKLEIGFKKGN